MRILTLYILCCMLFTPAASFASAKNQVAIFQYKGANSPLSRDKYETFQQIIEDKIDNLKREVFQSIEQMPDYLRDVEIIVHDEDNFTRRSSINRWLKNQRSVLCLLRGAIVSDDNMTYMVKSNFHLGELTGYFPYDVVKIDLPVLKSEHANTKDSHSLVLLYALAMDARRIGADNNDVAIFLTSALNKLADIKRRRGQLEGDLATLEQAIVKTANEILGGDNGS